MRSAIGDPEVQEQFRSFDRAKKGDSRLTGTGLYNMVRKLGEKAGLKVWPHGLRHAGITGSDLTIINSFFPMLTQIVITVAIHGHGTQAHVSSKIF